LKQKVFRSLSILSDSSWAKKHFLSVSIDLEQWQQAKSDAIYRVKCFTWPLRQATELDIRSVSNGDLLKCDEIQLLKYLGLFLVAIVPPERWGKMDRNDCHTAWENLKTLCSSHHHYKNNACFFNFFSLRLNIAIYRLQVTTRLVIQWNQYYQMRYFVPI
jgi:hypothetical protein